MMRLVINKLLFVLWFGFTMMFSTVSYAQSHACVTPDGKNGECVQVQSCVSIFTALKNKDHINNPEVALFLQHSQCGLKAGSHKVCCSQLDIDRGSDASTIPNFPQYTTVSPPIVVPQTTPNKTPTMNTGEVETQYAVNVNCGKLSKGKTQTAWIGELWFKTGYTIQSAVTLESNCIGTLISNNHLAVPAHCVANLPNERKLQHVKIDGIEYTVERITIHPNYNEPKFAHDIAVVEIRNIDQLTPICLASVDPKQYPITTNKYQNLPYANDHARFINSTGCSAFFNQQFTDLQSGQFCAYLKSNNSDKFVGSIIQYFNSNNRQYTIKGFASTAIRTGQTFDEERPFIFTDVAFYINWIKDVMNQHKDNEIPKNDQPKKCILSDGEGYCVKLDHCTLYKNEPRPVSGRLAVLLQQSRCFISKSGDNSEEIVEDGMCCPERFIDTTAQETDNSDVIDVSIYSRFDEKMSLLDLNTCGKVDSTKRIVGGSKAGLQEFPWMALLKYQVDQKFKFTCGSTLISSRYVLTAAHCITSLPQQYQLKAVRLGEYDRSTENDCQLVDRSEEEYECNPPVQDIDIEKVIPHPGYNNPRYSNDIGLVRMVKSPDMSLSNILPICLPVNAELRQTIAERYTVTGYGYTENGRDSDVLLKILVPFVPQDKCQTKHRAIRFTQGHMCYGGEGIIDSCKGDSGGPILNYATYKDRVKAVLFGVVAAGHADCGHGVTNFPGIYTNVTYYLEWVLNNMTL